MHGHPGITNEPAAPLVLYLIFPDSRRCDIINALVVETRFIRTGHGKA